MTCPNKLVFLAVFCLFTLPSTASAYGSYYQNQLNNSQTSYNLTFDATSYSEIVWINVPRRANVTSVIINLSDNYQKNYIENGTSVKGTGFSGDTNYCYDGDWTTCAYQNDGTSSEIIMNWTFSNFNVLDAGTNITYQYRVNNGDFVNGNLSIPQYCFRHDGGEIVEIHVGLVPSINVIRFYCYPSNDSAQLLYSLGGVAGPYWFCDSAIWVNHTISNITVDVLNDGSKDYNNKTMWNTIATVTFNSTTIAAINSYLTITCTADWATGTCNVPFNITSATAGILEISGINVSGYYFNQIGSCGGLYSQALNFSFKNETSLSSITASAEYAITMLDGSGQEYNASTGTVSSFNVCVLNGSFNADMIIKYEKTSMGTRFYFLDNATLISLALNNITLYLLDNSLGNSISTTVQNIFGYPIAGAYVQFQRYYIGENTYRTVAMLKTDDKGLTDVFLNTDNIWYKYVITQNGEVLRVIGPSTIIGTTLVLSTSVGEILTREDYATGISYSCTYSNSSYYLTCTVANPSGLANQVCLDVDEYNIVNISDYDLQCGAGASMTLISNLTNLASYNRTVRYMLYVVSPYVILESGSFQLGGTVIIFGLFGVLLTAVIFMVAAGIGIWNPAAGIITGIVGIIIAVTLGLFNVPIIALGSLIFVSIIIVYKVKT